MNPYRLELERRRSADPDVRQHRPAGAPAMVGRVTTAVPAVGKFLLVHPVTVTGTESEGSSGSLAVNTSASVPVLLLGPGVPATGDDLVCRFVDYRWVAERKVSGCTATFSGQVLDCLSHGLAGATVTVKDHTTHALLTTVTADGSGNFSGSVPVSGTSRQVDLQATYGSQASSSVLRTYSCGANSAQVLSVVVKPVTFVPLGCFDSVSFSPGFGCAPGINISVTDGTNTYTGVTVSGGSPANVCKITLPPGNYTVTGSYPRFVGGSTTFTVTNSCSPSSQTVTFSMGAPATGYACLCGFRVPVLTTLNGSGMGGTFTVTYDAATGQWNGSHFTATFSDSNPCCGSNPSVDAFWTLCHLVGGSITSNFFFKGGGSCPNASSPNYITLANELLFGTEAPSFSATGGATFSGTFGGSPCTTTTGPFTFTE